MNREHSDPRNNRDMRKVERLEDMSVRGHLRIYLQIAQPGDSVEFCVPGTGAGLSAATSIKERPMRDQRGFTVVEFNVIMAAILLCAVISFGLFLDKKFECGSRYPNSPEASFRCLHHD